MSVFQREFIINRTLVRLMFFCACVFYTATVASHAQTPISADEGLPHVRWSDAEKVVGSIAVVSGKITNVGQFGKVSFLNFDSRRDVFKAVVFRDDLEKFPKPLADLYENKLVMIRGPVTLYKDVPQIQIKSADQIRVVRKLPPTRIPQQRIRSVGDEIRIATFNIRNLFDGVDDPYYNDESTKAKPRSELEGVAKTIRKINSDILAMQEVESRGYLQRFNDVFLRDLGYEVVHFAGNDGRGSGLALLTRVRVGSVTSNRHRQFPDSNGVMRRFSRDCLQVELLPKTKEPFQVWVTHLKSKRGGAETTEPQRVAETAEIRRLLEAEISVSPKKRIFIVGDFNDTSDSKPIRRLVGTGMNQLHSFYQNLPKDSVTYNLPPYQAMIDFIFCTTSAARGYVPGSYHIENATLEQSGSDHNPVYADFKF